MSNEQPEPAEQSTPSARPRPQFGEYATPEQQAHAMGKRPIPPLRQFPQDQPPPPDPEHRVVLAAPTGHPVDRVITTVMLAFGVYSLFTGGASYLNFGSVLEDSAKQYGFSYTSSASDATAGYWLFALQLVLFAVTAVFSLVQLRRARLAFYIPLAGFAAFLVAGAIIVSTMLPQFLAQFSDHFST
jgi:hypothetical protein